MAGKAHGKELQGGFKWCRACELNVYGSDWPNHIDHWKQPTHYELIGRVERIEKHPDNADHYRVVLNTGPHMLSFVVETKPVWNQYDVVSIMIGPLE